MDRDTGTVVPAVLSDEHCSFVVDVRLDDRRRCRRRRRPPAIINTHTRAHIKDVDPKDVLGTTWPRPT